LILIDFKKKEKLAVGDIEIQIIVKLSDNTFNFNAQVSKSFSLLY